MKIEYKECVSKTQYFKRSEAKSKRFQTCIRQAFPDIYYVLSLQGVIDN